MKLSFWMAGALALATLSVMPGAMAFGCADAQVTNLVDVERRSADLNGGYDTITWYKHPATGSATYVLQLIGTGGSLVVSDNCGAVLCSENAAGVPYPLVCSVSGTGPFTLQVAAYSGSGYALALIAGSPVAANPAVATNPNGTCTIYNDANANHAVDGGEAIATVPCSASDVPISTPPESVGQSVPGTSTPGVPGKTITTDPVVTPATCTLQACTQPTVIPAQSTPPAPQQCVPPLVCVGPIGPQPLTPEETVAPLCTLASAICFPPTEIVPSTTVVTPGVPPQVLTPPISVSVSTTGFTGAIEPNAGEFTSIGPLTLQVGPVPVTLCPSSCPVPVPPEGRLAGSVTITVVTGSQTLTQTVPVNV